MLEIRPILSAMWRTKSSALLLIVQIALTLAIVSNAAFIITDRVSYMNRDSGVAEDEMLSFDVFSFGKDAKPLQQIELDEDMIRKIPGVIDAVVSNQVPMSGSGSSSGYRTNVDRSSNEGNRAMAGTYQGDSHFLSTLGLKLVAGRNFREDEIAYGDDEQESVVIITQELAKRLFPDGNALGQDIYSYDNPLKIIGIVERLQVPWVSVEFVEHSVIKPVVKARPFQRYIIRANQSARAGVMKQIEQKLHELYGERVVNDIQTLNENREISYADDALMTNMLMVLIVVLLLITGLGIVGMAFFNVNRRTKQIGTRRALGASKGDIIRYFIVENALIASIGITLGIGLSLVLNQLLISNYSLPSLDYAFIAATMAGIYVLGLLAVVMPAKRAAGISPAIATRNV